MSSSQSLNKETDRLKSFKNWNLVHIDKRLLAQIGFYHIGPTDLVKCYFCGVEIGMWQPEDNPMEEHLRWSPNCPLLLERETTNKPVNEEALKRILPTIKYEICTKQEKNSESYPEISFNNANISNIRDLLYQPSNEMGIDVTSLSDVNGIAHQIHEHSEFAIESLRMVSFEDWPKTMKQKPADLAEAGLYYTGRGDRVACFSCGGGLKDWEEDDVPWEQHAMWYSKCDYLILMKGEKFIDEILARKNSPLSLFINTPNFSTKLNTSEETKEKNIHGENDSSEVEDQEIGNKICKICYDAEYNTVFFPCGHIIACAKCASSVTTCPCCNNIFTKVKRVYFS